MRNIYLTILFLLCPVLGCFGQDLASIIDISQLYVDGRSAEACAAATARVNADSTDDAAYFYLAKAALDQAEVQKADSAISKAIALCPENMTYLETALEIAYEAHNMYKISDLCQALYESDPARYGTPTILIVMSDVYRRKGNFPAFFRVNNSIAADVYIDPDRKCEYIQNILDIVDNRFYQGWHTQLDEVVGTCLETHPADSSALKLAGIWYYRTSRPEQAKEYLNQLSQTYPDDFNAFTPLLEIALIESDYKQAEKLCKKALDTYDLTADQKAMLYSNLGDCSYFQGKTWKAFNCYEKALELNPEDHVLLNNYAYYLSVEGIQLRKAEKMASRSLELDPDNATTLDTYGWILYKMKRYKEAKPYFKRAIIFGGKESKEVLLHYSKVLKALGETELADYYKNLSDGIQK